MSDQKQLRSSRSKSRGRKSRKEPASTVSNTVSTHDPESQDRSPARDERLPEKVNNTDKGSVPTISTSSTKVSSSSQSQQHLEAATNVNTELTGDSNSSSKIPPRSEDVHANSSVPPLASTGVSDNTAPPVHKQAEGSELTGDAQTKESLTNLSREDPGKALLLVLAELQEIRTQMVELSKIESTTATLAEKISSNVAKTGELEKAVINNKSIVEELSKDYLALKKKVDSQDSKLIKVQELEKDFTETSEKTISSMNRLVDTQREQVDSFNSGAKQLQKDWKKEVMAEVDKRFENLEKERYFQSLKDRAFRNKLNLVIIGLPEDPDKSTSQIVKDLFSETLKVKNVKVKSTYRLGSQPQANSEYNRPVLVKFNNWIDRGLIWKKRTDSITVNDGIKIRIQADIPKPLREGIPTLYKVATAASKIQEFANAKVHDYQLELNGKIFQISDLEQLPKQIRPSTLATNKSDTHMVFFSRHTKLSNHYPSTFKVKGQSYHSMEHFLATRRAELSGREDMIKKAKEVQDPVQAKHILTTLHGDHQQEWDERVADVALEGLRAKFSQNPPLQEYLCSTGKLILGEASTNPRWGIGLDFNNAEVLDHSKWLEDGNLLGRSLMKLRAEFMKKKKKTK